MECVKGEQQAPTQGNSGWLSIYLPTVPLGAVAVTWILLGFMEDSWLWWSGGGELIRAGQVAPFGAVVYGAVMYLLEKTTRFFWPRIGRRPVRWIIKKALQEGIRLGRQMAEEEGQEK